MFQGKIDEIYPEIIDAAGRRTAPISGLPLAGASLDTKRPKTPIVLWASSRGERERNSVQL